MKKKLFNSLLFFLITFLLLEVSVRVIDPEMNKVNNAYSFVNFSNFEGGFNNKNFKMIMTVDNKVDHLNYYKGKGIDVSFDQFRGRYLDHGQRQLKNNVSVVLGDSFTLGYGVRYEDSLVGLLENSSSNTSLINIAKPKHNLFDAANYFHGWLAEYPKVKFNRVIYGLHINDIISFSTNLFSTHKRSNILSEIRKYSTSIDFLVYIYERVKSTKEHTQRILNLSDSVIKEKFVQLERIQTYAQDNNSELVVVLFPIFYKTKEVLFKQTYSKIVKHIKKMNIEVIDLTDGYTQEDMEYWIHRYDQHPNAKANLIFYEKSKSRLVL